MSSEVQRPGQCEVGAGAVTIATVSMEVSHDVETNLLVMERHVNDAADRGAQLVVLPEQCLQGYLTSTLRLDIDNVAHQFANAVRVPEDSRVRRMESLARRRGLYVVFGLTERDEHRDDVLYNTAVLLGPDGFVGKYRKTHQPGDEKHVYFPGHEVPVFKTAIGRIGLLICYDKVFPEVTRELALRGADILVMPTAWSLRGDTPGNVADDAMVDSHTLFGRTRALENQCWMVESNMIGKHGDFDYPGYSRVIDPQGRIRADTGPDAGIALASVDVRGEILRARSTDYMGYFFLKDYRPISTDVSMCEAYASSPNVIGVSKDKDSR